MTLESRLRRLHAEGRLDLPFPGAGNTSLRHRQLADLARSDLALARLAEAHVDAIAILHEAGRQPLPGIYGVWAAETAHLPLSLECGSDVNTLSGGKMFCSGAGLIDRALVTVEGRLLDAGLRDYPDAITVDTSAWKTNAFAETQTATVTFAGLPISDTNVVGENNWYVERAGFWHGACGPAACWAGGAMGLFDYAKSQTRNDAHTLAHLAAIAADVWALWAYLDCAGAEIDANPADRGGALTRALSLRHLVEQAASDILTRIGRAHGPRALAYDASIAKRYQELELYIRQSHAERDLESLGRHLHGKLQPLPCAAKD